MAVAHSAASESHTGCNGSTDEASFSWTHVQSGTPQGVLVFVHTINNANNTVISVTYGGLALTRVAGAVAIDTAGEPGRTDMFFLGSGLGTGNQTIRVNRIDNGRIMYASAATVTAGADVNVTGIQIEEQNQTLSPVAVDDGSSGINSLRYAATYSGLGTVPPAGTGSTTLTSIDFGARSATMVRETTAGQGARNVGFNTGANSDDVAAVYVAVREVTAWSATGETGSFTLTGNDATLTVAAVKAIAADLGTFTLTGNVVNFAQQYKITIDAGDFALTGNDATLEQDPAITAETGAFSLTGNAATLAKSAAPKIIVADTGTFALTGGAPSISVGHHLDAATGSFSLTGNSAGLADTERIEAETGVSALTGNTATVRRGFALAADPGAFTLTGNAATLESNAVITADPGTFALNGQQATLRQNYRLTAATGTFTATGQPATLRHNLRIEANTGAFALTGGTPAVLHGRYLSGGSGTFIETGQPATFRRTWAIRPTAGVFALTGITPSLTGIGA